MFCMCFDVLYVLWNPANRWFIRAWATFLNVTWMWHDVLWIFEKRCKPLIYKGFSHVLWCDMDVLRLHIANGLFFVLRSCLKREIICYSSDSRWIHRKPSPDACRRSKFWFIRNGVATFRRNSLSVCRLMLNRGKKTSCLKREKTGFLCV